MFSAADIPTWDKLPSLPALPPSNHDHINYSPQNNFDISFEFGRPPSSPIRPLFMGRTYNTPSRTMRQPNRSVIHSTPPASPTLAVDAEIKMTANQLQSLLDNHAQKILAMFTSDARFSTQGKPTYTIFRFTSRVIAPRRLFCYMPLRI